MTKARELAELGAVYDSGALSNRNLIINGAMQVTQRGTSFTNVSSGNCYIDRIKILKSGLPELDVEQSSDAPAGFSNSFKITVSANATSSLASGDYGQLNYWFEGQDLQRLAYGTSDAKPVSISFWVKTNKTGVYVIRLYSDDHGTAINASFTVNSSATWEYKTVTLNGDAVNAITNDNTLGLRFTIWLYAGSNFTSGTLGPIGSWGTYVAANTAVGNTNLADANSNYWQITGVQLEVGTEATPFEHRSFGDELARCQRYYQKSYEYEDAPTANDSKGTFLAQRFNVSDRYFILGGHFRGSGLRATPTLSIYSRDGTANNMNQYNGASVKISINSISGGDTKKIAGYLDNNSGSGTDNVQEFHWEADAEL